MAEYRMLSKQVVDSDKFLDMPLTTQALYFHLALHTDDEGFVSSPRKIQRSIGCSGDDMKLLIAKNFLIPFESGVVVLVHWELHNHLRKDRLKPTIFTAEKACLTTLENGEYSLVSACHQDGDTLTASCLPKVREGKNTEPIGSSPAPLKKKTEIIRHKYGEYHNVLLSDDELERLKSEIPDYLEYIEKLSAYMASTGRSYKSHLATIRNWKRKDVEKNGHNGTDKQNIGNTQKSKYGITI